MLSLTECIPWMTVGLAESVAIATLNLCTIITFKRNRNLRKRSMYLIINLVVTDMFVAGNVVFDLFYGPGVLCNLWTVSIEDGTSYFILVMVWFFPIGSLTNMAIIALERVHATVYPFRHRMLKKWVYRLLIAALWVSSGLLTIAYILLTQFDELYYSAYLYYIFILIWLLIISVSYTSIVIKVRCGAQPQHHGATSRERKLTMTLLIATVVSLLLCLPLVIMSYVRFIRKSKILQSLSFSVRIHLIYASWLLFYSNSLVNPILYTIRLPEYRSALLALFRKRPQQQRQVAVFRLRDM